MRSWNTTPCKDQSPVSALLQKSIFQTGYHQGIISGTPISDKSRLFFGTAAGRTKKSGAEAPLYHNFYLLRLFILPGIVQTRPSLRGYTGSVSRHISGQGTVSGPGESFFGRRKRKNRGACNDRTDRIRLPADSYLSFKSQAMN